MLMKLQNRMVRLLLHEELMYMHCYTVIDFDEVDIRIYQPWRFDINSPTAEVNVKYQGLIIHDVN